MDFFFARSARKIFSHLLIVIALCLFNCQPCFTQAIATFAKLWIDRQQFPYTEINVYRDGLELKGVRVWPKYQQRTWIKTHIRTICIETKNVNQMYVYVH